MRRFRFSIAHLLLLVLFSGVGFAALRSPSQLWASGWFSAALATLTIAVLVAVYRRGRRRAFWVGFASCGWAYLVLALGPGLESQTSAYLVTTAVLDMLFPQFEPPPPPAPAPASGGMMMGMMGGSMMGYGAMPGAGGPGPMGGMPMPPPMAPSPVVTWTVPVGSPESFQRIGHSQFSLLFALLGGFLTRRLHATREEPAE
jgi:hypothetical protein